MSEWTIQKLLDWMSGYLTERNVDGPRLSAELLLSSVLQCQRIDLYARYNTAVAQEHLDELRSLVKRAGAHEPVVYLVGKTEFYSLEIEVTPDCLIPRPETELLVQRAIEYLRGREGTQNVCDLCTGCGCIGIAITRHHPAAKVFATDISAGALDVAARNAAKHQVAERVKLLCGDLFEPLVPQLDVAQFDLIVCNPPYVSAAEYEALEKNVKDYEPRIALLAGDDGLDVYRRICEKIDAFLKPAAALMLEIGYAQGPPVRELLETTGIVSEIRIEKDLHNNDRIVTATKISA